MQVQPFKLFLIVGAHLGLYSLEKYAFTSSNSTSQETSSNPQRPATPLSWGMGSLGTLEYPAFAGGQEAAANRTLLLGELLVLPSLATGGEHLGVKTTAPQEACCVVLVLAQPMEGCWSLSHI